MSTNPTRVLNPKVNMAVRFNVACEATGHKITDMRVQISNKTIDCEREPKLCRGKNLGTNLQILFYNCSLVGGRQKFHSEDASIFFSVHSTLEEFKNQTITAGHF